jgi:two-component sensor histidine kinase
VAHDLRHRITALGRAHDFVRPHSPQSRPSVQQDSLHGLLGELFVPYRRDDGDRVRVSGDDVAVDDRAATPLALLFHELATNASKYGALSVLDGRVDLSVARRDEVVTLTWAERDGPAVSPPPASQHGFGSQLIEMSAVRQLGGSVTRDWRPAGLVVEVTVPVPAFSRVAAT